MNTRVWLVRFTDRNERPAAVVHTHNPIADYRQVDPKATAVAIDVSGALALIEAVESGLRYGLAGIDPSAIDAIRAALFRAKDTQ